MTRRGRRTKQNMRKQGTAFIIAIITAASILFSCLAYTVIGIAATMECTDEESCARPSSSSSEVALKRMKSTNHKNQRTSPNVEYLEIQSNRDNVRRYVAVRGASKGPNPPYISVQSWMEMVASSTPEGRQTASDLSSIIASSPYSGLLFETRGTSRDTASTTPFEFVLVNKPSLTSFAEASPDRQSFSEQFRECGNGSSRSSTCCSFENLGRDALLVAPLPQEGVDDVTYSHLAPFARWAPEEQIAEFWRLGATKYLEALDNQQEVWLSTNGMGVAWLHLRLDNRPKYYGYVAYRRRDDLKFDPV